MLAEETMNAIMKISINGPDMDAFNPIIHVEKWINKSTSTRHLQGHKKAGGRKEDKNTSAGPQWN